MTVYWLSIVAAFGAGFINAIAGGGTLLTFPALLYGGMPAIAANATSTILSEMWEKLAHLSTAAAMTCLMRGSVGEIAATPDGAKIFLRLFDLAGAKIGRAHV